MDWRTFRLFGGGRSPAPLLLAPSTTEPGNAPPKANPIQSANELLKPRGEWVQRIESLAGTSRPHFAQYYLPVIKRFAEFVQLCPASEAHHHAHLGGLLDHALEVATLALQIRQGYLLPPDAPAEERPLRQDTWTYAVFTGAFLHDLGKPVVDLAVTLYSADGSSHWPWNPWRGSMCRDDRASGYQIEYRKHRTYQMHERAALLLAQQVIPAEGLEWLAQDREAFGAWLAYASGDSLGAGVLGEILTQADRHSVAQNLGADAAPRAILSKVIPLHEKLLTALKYLIERQELPLNRNGAAGWLIQNDLWLVSKRVADALRAHLTLNGHGGIPSSNDRLFDVLQDHGLLMPCEDRAIWRAEVRGENWAHPLTLIRIPAQRLWADPGQWPSAFGGTVVPASPEIEQPATGSSSELTEAVTVQPLIPSAAISSSQLQPAADQAVRSAEAGNEFLSWIRDGLRTGRMSYNAPSARIHVVPEGVLLVSPAIFRDYAADHPDVGDWQKVQRQFLKLGIHQIQGDVNMHGYRINESGTMLSGLVIREVSLVLDGSPDQNPALAKL